MKTSTTVVTNVSKQVVKVLYSEVARDASSSVIPPNTSGELAIAPGGKLTIESSRLDAGQLEAFRKKGLVSYTIY